MNKSITISLKDYINLLEIKLIALKEAKDKDSSWNYNIEELEEEIKQLKNQY